MDDKNQKHILVNDDSSIYEIDNECMKKKENGESDCFDQKQEKDHYNKQI